MQSSSSYIMHCLIIFILSVICTAHSNPFSKISSQLQARLQNGKHADIVVTLAKNTSALRGIESSSFQSRAERISSVYSRLSETANHSQQGILKLLSNSKKEHNFTSFWITNQIFVKKADINLIQEIAEDPQVSSIDTEIIITLKSIETVSIVKQEEQNGNWSLSKIQLFEAWKELNGSYGDGVIVGSLSTGIHGTHQALMGNFLGKHGWLDPSSGSLLPIDDNGIGTHSMGIIVGSHGIGIAPNAKWSACKACNQAECHQQNFLTCGQFFLKPTLANGSNPDFSKAPHIISNPWSGAKNQTWFNDIIGAWHAAGIIPVFPVGDSGPLCSTADYPGDQHVITVGSTNEEDAISDFSSVGPTLDGRMKPDVTAPGEKILSAVNSADDAYTTTSSTYSASQHVAGLIALLITRNKTLAFEDARNFLIQGTDKELKFSGRNCENVSDNAFPNHIFGHGRINALKSIQAQTKVLNQASGIAPGMLLLFIIFKILLMA